MTLSSPKRPILDKRLAPRAALLSGLVLAFGLSANDAAHATLPSSTSYAIESQAFASGGSRTTSTGYILTGTFGQSSALGAGASVSYALLPGFQATLDGDGDGYPNHVDVFPNDPTEWIDTDGDTIGNNADTDDDGDGMPDAWETDPAFAGLLDPLVDDAAGDVDGDGFSNLEEYIAGTDPTDAVSRPIQMADFNYNFRSDILWRHDTDGRAVIWLMDGFAQEDASKISEPGLLDWYIAGIADFNADGNADILWRNRVTDSIVIWMMDEFAKLATGAIGVVNQDWLVKGLGDFDGDGKTDILWRNEIGGNTVIWRMDEFTKLETQSIGVPDLEWVIEGVADFTDDDKSDILWHNSATGNTVVWAMNGFERTGAASLGAPPMDWGIEGVADFNGGGQPDILWRNATTAGVVVWQMNGYVRESTANIGAPPLNWEVVRLGDYNGGGQADILWFRSIDARVVVWQMNGLVREDAQAVGQPTGWTPL